MKQRKLTGRHYFKRNWLGYLILYVEVEEIYTDGGINTIQKVFIKANEQDLIGWKLSPEVVIYRHPLIKEETAS